MNRLRSSSTLALLAAAAACAADTATAGQRITCTVDPDSGVILACEPGGGGGEGRCEDIDEDGDGHPDDGAGPGTIARTGSALDQDGDGIPDTEDCDEEEGGDWDAADLPYDVKMRLGEVYTPIVDAFAEKGAQPQEVIEVVMDGGGGAGWRLAELTAGTSFVVTQADCDHAGNRDVGRDRVLVTWRNADGSVETDHLDLRYCE